MTIPIDPLPDDPAARLGAALAALGVVTPVLADGALALLRPADPRTARALAAALSDQRVRARVLEAARAAGFTHAALEIPEPGAPDLDLTAAPDDAPASPAAPDAEPRCRLFVGVMLPEPVAAAVEQRVIAPLRRAVPDADWVSADRLHLTLKFLGEQPAGLVAPLSARLADVAAGERAFQLTLSGVGAFPGMQRPRVIWLGGRDAGECTRLAHRVDDACEAFGIPRDDRAFRPHVTVARLRVQRAAPGRAAPLLAGLREAAAPLGQEWALVVREIALVQSVPTADGSRYTVLARLPLAAMAR